MVAVGPALIRTLTALRRAAGGGTPDTIQMDRDRLDKMSRLMPKAKGTEILEVDAGGVPGEWVRVPGSRRGRGILHLHGGGYYTGSRVSHRGLTSRIAEAAEAEVLAIDYRLAPEHKFPAALDDAVGAFRFMIGLGFDPASTAVTGDSAGGGLAVSTRVYLRDAGDRLPAASTLMSPWVDLTGSGQSVLELDDQDPWLNADGMHLVAEAYVGDLDPATPLASPLFADLAGLPPLLIQVGTREILLDDARRLATAARAAGVDVTLDEWRDQIHDFQLFSPFISEAAQAIAAAGRFLRHHLA